MVTVSNHAPLFGKDILTRMLDMEKLSQIQRESRSTPDTPLTTTASSSHIPQVSKVQTQTSRSPDRTSVRPPNRPPSARSATAPNLTLDLSRSQAVASQLSNNQAEPTSPSICHSPTWSVRGKERTKQDAKRAAKEKKEQDKKMKKAEEQEKKKLLGGTRPNKRLSKKPPPAAMETQRMPIALSRQSESTASRSRDTSADRSRPSSKDGRRSSVSSLTSLMRLGTPFLSRRGSSSQPQSPAKSAFEKTPDASPRPELAEKHNKSKATPKVTIETDDEESYLKDLKEFAYQVNGSIGIGKSASASPAQPEVRESSLPSPLPLQLDAAIPGSPGLTSSTENLSEKTASKYQRLQTGSRPDRRSVGVMDNSPRGYHYPTLSNSSIEQHKDRRSSSAKTPYSFTIPQSLSAPSLAAPVANSTPSSSYVKKQRMHHQQQSISGYREEWAVSQAVKTAALGPNMPPTPDESTESLGEDEKLRTVGPAHEDKRHGAVVETKSTLSGPGPKENANSGKTDSSPQLAKPPNHIKASTHAPQPSRSHTEIKVSESDSPRSRPLSRINNYEGIVDPLKIAKIGAQQKNEAVQKESKSQESDNKVLPAKAAKSPPASATQSSNSGERPKAQFSILSPSSFFPRFSRSSTEPEFSNTKRQPSVPDKEPPQTLATIHPEVPNKSPLRGVRHSLYLEASESQLATEAKVTNQELVVEGVDGDGLLRKTSIKRHRSDPELNVAANDAKKPDLDFLPELKHQPLIKPKRTSGAKVSFVETEEADHKETSQFPLPASTLDFSPSKSSDILALPQPPFAQTGPGVRRQSAIKASKRSSFGSTQMLPLNDKSQVAGQALNVKPIAKMFVICCKCKYWHDLPSSLYEAMAMPKTISQEDGIAQSIGAKHGPSISDGPRAKVAAQVFTQVKCPWCEHGMSTSCCAGWTSIVYLHERHH